MTTDELAEKIAGYLDSEVSDEELLKMFQEADQCDGSWNGEWDVMDFDDAAEMAGSAAEFGRAIVEGDVTSVLLPVAYDAYGNLKTVYWTDFELDARERAEELANWLATSGWHDSINLPEDLARMIESARGE